MTRDEPNWELLVRHFAGTSSREDDAVLAAWVEARPERAEELDALRCLWDQSADTSALPAAYRARWDHAAMWRDLTSRLEQPVGQRPSSVLSLANVGATQSRARVRLVHATLAAGLAVVAVTGVAVARWGGAASDAGLRTYATGPGRRETVTLADGTQLTLAPGSRLQVAAAYGRGHRDVLLEGEGYFVVTHDPAHPFTVRARNVVARDVGTRFAVRAYAEDAAVSVGVVDGQVAVWSPSADITASGPRTRPVAPPVLVAGDLARVDSAGRDSIAHGVDTVAYVGWTVGRLAFTHARLATIVPDLERWYNLDVRLADPALGARRVTSRFDHEPVDQVLTALALAVDARVERRGRVATFYPANGGR